MKGQECAKYTLQTGKPLIVPAFRGIRLKPDGQILVNLGLVHRDGEVVTYWDAWIADMRAQGYRRFGWYVWDQGSGFPGNWNGRLGPSHEFVFHFNRSPRQVNKTKVCTTAGLIHRGGGMRGKDGLPSKYTDDGKPRHDTKIPDSVIRVSRGRPESLGHPAVFPVDLAHEVIVAFTSTDDLIVEPFSGSGTTLVAAKRLGRRAIGIEIEERYCEIAARRIEAERATLFEAPPEQLGLMGGLDA